MGDFEIIFEGGLTARDRYEMEARGYRSHVKVTLHGNTYPVLFYDAVRLAQVLEEETFIAEPGLIVLQKVDEERMREAVAKLVQEGYFEHLKPE
ncbi:MAG TPA: hypothetical protein DCO77_04275 [Nitrospiraceae bacterium]|nr:hypothetical protein [Nitrospiraceae bacterium]